MYIISIIIYNGCIYYIYRCSDLAGEIDILILGAWGCGAFGHALNSLASLCRMVYIIYIYGNYRIFIYIYCCKILQTIQFCRGVRRCWHGNYCPPNLPHPVQFWGGDPIQIATLFVKALVEENLGQSPWHGKFPVNTRGWVHDAILIEFFDVVVQVEIKYIFDGRCANQLSSSYLFMNVHVMSVLCQVVALWITLGCTCILIILSFYVCSDFLWSCPPSQGLQGGALCHPTILSGRPESCCSSWQIFRAHLNRAPPIPMGFRIRWLFTQSDCRLKTPKEEFRLASLFGVLQTVCKEPDMPSSFALLSYVAWKLLHAWWQ